MFSAPRRAESTSGRATSAQIPGHNDIPRGSTEKSTHPRRLVSAGQLVTQRQGRMTGPDALPQRSATYAQHAREIADDGKSTGQGSNAIPQKPKCARVGKISDVAGLPTDVLKLDHGHHDPRLVTSHEPALSDAARSGSAAQ